MTKYVSLFFLLFAFMTAIPAGAVGPGDIPKTTIQELKTKLDNGENVVILDVRSRGSWRASDVKIKGAVRIPPDELRARASELPFTGEIVAYCTCPDEASSIGAGIVLKRMGFQRVSALLGGFDAWVEADYPLEPK